MRTATAFSRMGGTAMKGSTHSGTIRRKLLAVIRKEDTTYTSLRLQRKPRGR